jgi:hypothetical protein
MTKRFFGVFLLPRNAFQAYLIFLWCPRAAANTGACTYLTIVARPAPREL